MSSSTVAIADLEVHLPAERASVDELLAANGIKPASRKVFGKLFNLDRIAVAPPDQGLVDLLLAAGRRLLDRIDPAEIDLVLYGHTNLYAGPSQDPVVQRVLAGLGLEHVPMYGISQIACTSVLRSVELAERFLARRPDRRAVLVLGGDHSGIEPKFRIIPGMTVTGDGAVALLVRKADERTRYRWLGTAQIRDTRFHRGARMTQEDLKEYTGQSTAMITEAVDLALKEAGLGRDDLDWVLPHSSNAMLWRIWCKETGFPRESVYLDLVPKLGHTVGNDALICLAHGVDTGRIRTGQRCVLIALGQGAYFHAAVIEVQRAEPARTGAAAAIDVEGRLVTQDEAEAEAEAEVTERVGTR